MIAGFFNFAKEKRKQPQNDHVSCNWINEVIKSNHQKCVSFFRYSGYFFKINLSSPSSKEYAMRIALKVATGEMW